MSSKIFVILKTTISSRCLQPLTSWQRWYAAKPVAAFLGKKMGKVGGKLGAVVEKKVMPVETDPQKLVNFVCGSNIKIKGEDIKLKPDIEYPDWLWTLNINRPKTLQELDPESKAYWRKLRQIGLRRNNQLQKIKRF